MYSLLLREDKAIAALPERVEAPHMEYITGWRGECQKMQRPYEFRVAEPQGIRIVQSLLKKHSLQELKEMGRHFLLDYGDRLREDPRHFSLFASLIPTMKKELNREE